MEFRKMVMMTLYAREQKRHRYKEQTFGLWEKARVGWFERITLKHVHYHIKTDDHCKPEAWSRHIKILLWDNPED